jgi:hypothetical protein
MKHLFTLLALLFTLLLNQVKAQLNPVGSYDSCGAAIDLSVNTTCITGSQTYTTTGATKSPQLSAGISNDDDVWFKFTTVTGQTHASIQLSNEVGGMGSCLELWTNCSASVDFSNSCGSQLSVSGLTPLTTYWVRVYTNGTFATLSSFQICVVNTTPPPAPPNSECAFATNILTSNNSLTCNLFPISNRYATGSTVVAAPACLSSNYRDVWLKFTPTQTGSFSFRMQDYVAISGSTFPTYYIAAYNGSTCNSLSLINCSSYSPTSNNDYLLSGTYNAGTTYYLRILCSDLIEGNFNVCIKPLASAATYPISSDSTCLKSITINSSLDTSAVFTQGSTNGIRRINQLACYGYDAPNALAWYNFTVPANGNYYVDFTDLQRLDINAFGAGYRILRRSTCYTTGTDTIITTPPINTYDTLLCANSFDGGQTVALTTGTQYYVTVMENSYNGGRVAYKLRVVGASTSENDDSTNAINIIQDVNCNSAINTSLRFSTLSTQPNVSGLVNSSGFKQDVWYKFTAVTTSVVINVTLSSFTTRIAVYNSDGSLKYDPATNGNIITVNSLTVGSRYLIRIINSSGTPIGPNANFKICVFGASPSVATTVASCTTADATKISTNSNQWLHFTNAGNLIVSVFDGPAKPGFTFLPRGTISASYFTNTGGIRLNAGTAYLDRNFELSDGGNNFSNSPVKIRFYLTVAEFNTLITSDSNGGITAPHELRVYRIPGASCSNSTTAGGLYYNIDSYGYISNSLTPSVIEGYYVDMITPNFSGFFLQWAADNLLVPANCGSFTYQIKNNKVEFSLTTLSENNTQQYVLQQSINGLDYTTLSSLNAKNSNTNNYVFITELPTKKSMYRVKQINKDGNEKIICKTISIQPTITTNIIKNISPNPAVKDVQIEMNVNGIKNAEVYVINNLGLIITKLNIGLTQQQTSFKIPVNHLSAGIYFIKLVTDKGIEVKKFIKQ